MATIASSFDRGSQPSERRAFSLVAFIMMPSRGTRAFIAGSRIAAMRISQFGSHTIAGDRNKALAVGGGIRHRAQVQVGDIAYIDKARVDLWASRYCYGSVAPPPCCVGSEAVLGFHTSLPVLAPLRTSCVGAPNERSSTKVCNIPNPREFRPVFLCLMTIADS